MASLGRKNSLLQLARDQRGRSWALSCKCTATVSSELRQIRLQPVVKFSVMCGGDVLDGYSTLDTWVYFHGITFIIKWTTVRERRETYRNMDVNVLKHFRISNPYIHHMFVSTSSQGIMRLSFYGKKPWTLKKLSWTALSRWLVLVFSKRVIQMLSLQFRKTGPVVKRPYYQSWRKFFGLPFKSPLPPFV